MSTANKTSSASAWPPEISDYALWQWVKVAHRCADDVAAGDLYDRLSAYDLYRLTAMPVASFNPNQFLVFDDLVDDYCKMIGDGSRPPPIIYDPKARSLIDGIHRLNAALRCGRTEILTYVGVITT